MPFLPITPQPRPDESIFGWAIRLAEGNIVPSPWHIYKLIGFSQGEMTTPRLDVSRLWHLISDDPTILDPLKYTNGAGYAIRGQPIGARELSVRTARLCPDCVAATGIAYASWDLELATCCHIHRRRLLHECPQCNKKITWFRNRLLVCLCGGSFCEAPMEVPSDAELALNKVVYENALRHPCGKPDANPALRALGAVPLQYLLRFIRTVGTLSTQGRLVPGKRKRTPPQELVIAAAKVLDAWPSNFHDFLTTLANRPQRAGQERLGVMGYLNDFLAAVLGRSDERKHGELFASELRRFLACTWDGPLDPGIIMDLASHDLTPRWIPISMAAQRLKVDKRTLMQIVNRGLIRSKTEATAKSRHVLVLSADIKPEWFAPTPLLNDRTAASRLGIPVSVLRALRHSGEYVQSYFGPDAMSFATRDVDALMERVISGKHYVQNDPDHGVTLGNVMRMKFRSSAVKTDIIRSTIAGQIRTVANRPDTLASLILHPGDFERVRERLTRPTDGFMTVKQAGVALHATKEVVEHLVESGHLERAGNSFVQSESIKGFLERYACLNSLLNHRKDKIALAEKACAHQRIDLIIAPSIRGSFRRFVRKVDVPAIKELVIRRATTSSRWSRHAHTSEMACHRYD